MIRRIGKLHKGLYTGQGWDCGFGIGLSVVPKGTKGPLAVVFTLADPQDDLARVLPHGSHHANYLR